jgi:glucose-1-phosphate adenylyltransferase
MKSEGKDYLASMGIYIFNRELLVELIIQILKILKEIIPLEAGTKKTYKDTLTTFS